MYRGEYNVYTHTNCKYTGSLKIIAKISCSIKVQVPRWSKSEITPIIVSSLRFSNLRSTTFIFPDRSLSQTAQFQFLNFFVRYLIIYVKSFEPLCFIPWSVHFGPDPGPYTLELTLDPFSGAGEDSSIVFLNRTYALSSLCQFRTFFVSQSYSRRVRVCQWRLYCIYAGLLRVTESHFNIFLEQGDIRVSWRYNSKLKYGPYCTG